MIGAIVGDIAGSRFEFCNLKSKGFALLLSVMAVGWAMGAAAVETESCARWDDIGTNLALPDEIAGMRMQTRRVYGENDMSFGYGSRELVAGTDGQRVLTLYLYKRAGVELETDGVGDDVRKEMTSVVEAVRVRPDREFTSVEVLEKERLGKIGATDCLTAEFAYKDGKSGSDMRGWALVCSFMGRIGHGLGDYETPGDNEIASSVRSDKLYETVGTMNKSWGYRPTDTQYRSVADILAIKEKCRSIGSNYMLNVGPDPLGRFPAAAVDILNGLSS